jgi:hypothetical protein
VNIWDTCHMTSKTQFQIECENALIELVSSTGHSFSEKSLIIGDEENFIEGNVSGFKFWIYEDGAAIQTKDEGYRLEEEDFDSLEQLQKKFLSIFKRLLTLQILDKSSIKISINLSKLIGELLSYVPEEHLAGLDSIILVDRLLGTKHKTDPALYRKQNKSTPANIELSLNGIYYGYPKKMALIPFVRKIMPALSLYREVGNHYAHIKGDVPKNEWQAFIKKYPKPYLKKAFPYSLKIFKFLLTAYRWLKKDSGK